MKILFKSEPNFSNQIIPQTDINDNRDKIMEKTAPIIFEKRFSKSPSKDISSEVILKRTKDYNKSLMVKSKRIHGTRMVAYRKQVSDKFSLIEMTALQVMVYVRFVRQVVR